MATLSFRLDLYVLKLKAYKIIPKVSKFQLPTYYSLSTAERGNMLVGGFRPLGLIGLSYGYYNPLLRRRRNDLVFGMAIHLK